MFSDLFLHSFLPLRGSKTLTCFRSNFPQPLFTYEAMTSTAPISLRNPVHFPFFDACPSEYGVDPNFYSNTEGVYYQPSRHWCLLASVLEVIHFVRLRLVAQDATGKRINIAFYLESGVPPNVKVGDTIAVLYAPQHHFLDGTAGVRVEEGDEVLVCATYIGDVDEEPS